MKTESVKRDAVALVPVLLSAPVRAAEFGWDGGGSDDSWDTGARWVGDLAARDSSDGVVLSGAVRTPHTSCGFGRGSVMSLQFAADAASSTCRAVACGDAALLPGRECAIAIRFASDAQASERTARLAIAAPEAAMRSIELRGGVHTLFAGGIENE